MLNRRTIIAVLVFVFAGLMIFTFANPGDPANDDVTLEEQLNDAEDVVVNAEESLLQTDVDAAYVLVNDLPDSDEKTALVNRLVEVEKIIAAREAVETAEESTLQSDVDAARDLVNELAESEVKDQLSARLDAIDTVAPIITLNGAATISNAFGVAYAELGATAVDNFEGNISSKIITTGTVNVNALGSYTITYTVSDLGGNTTTVTRIVNVVDNTIPVITLNGASTITLEMGLNTYSELGATAVDNVNGNITGRVVISGTVNNNVVGTYNITYNVTDLSGNAAVPVVRRVNVVNSYSAQVNAVIKVEQTYLKSDFDMAWPLVNALPDNTVKTDLINRLNVVQGKIDAAIAAVMLANTEKTQITYDAALVLVNALPNTYENKTRMLSVLAAILAEAKTNAVNNLEEYVHENEPEMTSLMTMTGVYEDDYSEANWQTILSHKTRAINAINGATTFALINEVYTKAINAIDAVLTAEEEADILALAQAKHDAIEHLEIYVHENIVMPSMMASMVMSSGVYEDDYSEANWQSILTIKANAIIAINNATTVAEVNTLYDNAIIAIDAVLTLEEEEAAMALAQAKFDAIEALEHYVHENVMENRTMLSEMPHGVYEDDYSMEKWQEILTIKANAIVAINNAMSIDEVDDIYDDAIEAINDVITLHDEVFKAYNDALKAVKKADYTSDSWTEYDLVVKANKVTKDNTTAEIKAATAAIILAQANLVIRDREAPKVEIIVTFREDSEGDHDFGSATFKISDALSGISDMRYLLVRTNHDGDDYDTPSKEEMIEDGKIITLTNGEMTITLEDIEANMHGNNHYYLFVYAIDNQGNCIIKHNTTSFKE